MNRRAITILIALALGLSLADVQADQRAANPHAGHAAMQTLSAAEGVPVKGVIKSIDAQGRAITVIHEPVETLGWPEMTMDLPVTRQVELTGLNVGDEVLMTLKQGRDKKYRIISIEK